MLDWTLFHASTALNLILLALMGRCSLWRFHPVACALQLYFLGQTVLFLILSESSPQWYAYVWPIFDQYNILCVIFYAWDCSRSSERIRYAAPLLFTAPLLKLEIWAAILAPSIYRAGSIHYTRIGIDLFATAILIWAVYHHPRKEFPCQSKTTPIQLNPTHLHPQPHQTLKTRLSNYRGQGLTILASALRDMCGTILNTTR